MLSDMFIHTLLTRDFAPVIQSRYHTALDVHSRVETDKMMQIMRQLTSLGRTYETLRTVINIDLLNPATSIVGDIYNAVDRVVQETHDSVQEFHTRLLQPFTETYEKKVDFFVRRIVNHANAFLAHHASSDSVTFANADVRNSSLELCRSYVKFWTWYKYDYRDAFKAIMYRSHKTCTKWFHDTCKTYLDIEVLSDVEQKKLPDETKIWLKCMTQFRQFLDDATSWVKARATLTSSLPIRTTTDDAILEKLKDNTDRLAEMTERFRLHHITKV